MDTIHSGGHLDASPGKVCGSINRILATVTTLADIKQILRVGEKWASGILWKGVTDYLRGKRSFIYDSDILLDLDRTLSGLGVKDEETSTQLFGEKAPMTLRERAKQIVDKVEGGEIPEIALGNYAIAYSKFIERMCTKEM